jgi:translation elongation factor EF-4
LLHCHFTDSRTTLVFNIPLAEVVTDYFDQLKSRSKGYASMEYKIIGYRCGVTVSRVVLHTCHGRLSQTIDGGV